MITDISPYTLALILAAAFASAIIGGLGGFGTGIILSGPGIGLGVMIGLASLPGSWVASRLVHKLGAKLHIVVIELLIISGGLSILVQGFRAL